MYERNLFKFLFSSKSIYLFISKHFVPFKVIFIRCNALIQRFLQSSKHFWKVLFDMAISLLFDSDFMPSIVINRFPLIGPLFSFVNKEKSQGAKSSEYSVWVKIAVLFLTKKSRTIMSEPEHYRDRLSRIASRKRFQ